MTQPEQQECPICFHSTTDLWHGSCSHSFCADCCRQLLIYQPPAVPTLASCPVCRRPMSWFDLTKGVGGVAVVTTNNVPPQRIQEFATTLPAKLLGNVYSSSDFGGLRIEMSEIPCIQSAVHRYCATEWFWDDCTHTFHGTTTTTNQSITLTFSDNYNCIAVGVIRGLHDELDGVWRVSRPRCETETVQVVGGRFRRSGGWNHLRVSSSAVWMMRNHQFVTRASVDWSAFPDWSLPVSSALEFDFGEQWIRQSIEKHAPDVIVGGPEGALYLRRNGDLMTDNDQWHDKEIVGNTFVQGTAKGMASYHFVQTGGPYISYENPRASALWPRLDNGRPIPCRVYFEDYEYSARTFRGSICWKDTHHSTWGRCEKWEYEMNFDSKFCCILSGRVHSVIDGELHEMSVFGDDLLYRNAAAIPSSELVRLRNEGASDKLLVLVAREMQET